MLESGSLIISNNLLLLKSGSFIFLSISFIIGYLFFLQVPNVFTFRKSFLKNTYFVVKVFCNTNFIVKRYASCLKSFYFYVFILPFYHFGIQFFYIRSLESCANLLKHLFCGRLLIGSWWSSFLWRTFTGWAHLFLFNYKFTLGFVRFYLFILFLNKI